VEDFSHEQLINVVDYEDVLPDENGLIVGDFKVALDVIISALNDCRELYLKTKDKRFWYSIIQLLPSSYNQKATWTANYEVLRNIYHARKNHKLDEWHNFCHMIEDLPYSELITGEE
jgi:hypothetical protein